MPTPIEELLWTAVKGKKHDEVKQLIDKHSSDNLINAVHPEGLSFLTHYLNGCSGQTKIIPRDILEPLLLNPTLDWSFVSVETETTLPNSLISRAFHQKDLTMIEILKDVPGFLFSGQQLSYEVADKKLKAHKKVYEMHVRKNESQEVLDKDKLNIETYEAIVSLIRDMTILYAIKSDDATLFARLDKAGAQPTDFLGKFGNEELPTFLLTPANVRVKAWYSEKRGQTLTSAASNASAFFANAQELKNVQSHVAKVEENHLAKAALLQKNAAAGRVDRMQQAMASF